MREEDKIKSDGHPGVGAGRVVTGFQVILGLRFAYKSIQVLRDVKILLKSSLMSFNTDQLFSILTQLVREHLKIKHLK